MTHYYRKVRCPYCKKWTGHSHTHSQNLVGNPLRVCSHCNQAYWDFAYTEDAIFYYTQNTEPHLLAPSLFSLIAVYMLAMAIYCVIGKRYVGSVVLFAISIPLAYFVIKWLVKELHFAGHKDQLIAKTQNDIELSVSKGDAISDSIIRLSKPEYLDFLAGKDVEVPNYFYDRIHYYPAERYEEKHAKMVKKQETELEQLLEKQKSYRNAKHFLSVGIHDKEFKTVAAKVNMTPQEFREYCKKTIAEYEEMHREYNLTHSKPAPILSDYE